MYPRVEDFRAVRDDEYDPERGLRRGRTSRISGTAIALLLLLWLVAAAGFGGLIAVWTGNHHVRLWESKFGGSKGEGGGEARRRSNCSGADRGAVKVPQIQARSSNFNGFRITP